MKKIAILGHFSKNHPSVDGQTIKTLNLSRALSLSENVEVCEIDTHGWKRHPLRLILAINRAMKSCDAIIMLPARRGVQVFSYLLNALNVRKGRKIYYDVIGAWLPSLLKSKPHLIKTLKKFDGIWCETNTLKTALENMDFENVCVVPNFKDIRPIAENELKFIEDLPIRLVIFSRISKAKGVSDAIEAIGRTNSGSIKYTLDIYGPIDGSYRDRFNELVNENSSFVNYGGVVESGASVDVLKGYHALLFPTRYYTEGIPGTIIDAYCAGLPVISARWESYADICFEGETSLGYKQGNVDDLVDLLQRISDDISIVNNMKAFSLDHGSKYTITEMVKQICTLIDV